MLAHLQVAAGFKSATELIGSSGKAAVSRARTAGASYVGVETKSGVVNGTLRSGEQATSGRASSFTEVTVLCLGESKPRPCVYSQTPYSTGSLLVPQFTAGRAHDGLLSMYNGRVLRPGDCEPRGECPAENRQEPEAQGGDFVGENSAPVHLK